MWIILNTQIVTKRVLTILPSQSETIGETYIINNYYS